MASPQIIVVSPIVMPIILGPPPLAPSLLGTTLPSFQMLASIRTNRARDRTTNSSQRAFADELVTQERASRAANKRRSQILRAFFLIFSLGMKAIASLTASRSWPRIIK